MRHFLLYCLIPCLAYTADDEPYFAGTLLSTNPVNVAPAHWFIEPYLFITRQTTAHLTSAQLILQLETGLNDWVDITLYPNFYCTHSNSHSFYLLGDTKLSFGFQVLYEEQGTSIPSFRLLIEESFPTGKYNHLNPHANRADATGSGAYETFFSAVLYKTLLPFTLNLSLSYMVPTKAHVKGLNAYGGTSHTNTHLCPGQQLTTDLGIEYSLTQCWILGLDLYYQHQNASSQPNPTTGTPSQDQFSIAPCIEYNPSPSFGCEIGSWFTLYTRNCSPFISAVGTIYWSF